jgi:hypothetical protein
MDIARAISQSRPEAQWSLSGDDYSTLQWVGPGEPPTIDELEAAWAALQARKIWPTKAHFWDELTADEKAGILNSDHSGIKVLWSDLTMWPGEVWSDDTRIQQGLSGLVALGLLTAQRKDQILAKPQ